MCKVDAMRVALVATLLLFTLAETCPHGCTCPSYRKVGCYNSSLTSVPQDLYNEDVITLDLSHNAITELGQDSFKTHRLRYLFLNDNCITSVFKTTFWSLAELQNLFLNNNKITHIDQLTFLYNSKLKELDLSDNQLTSISDPTFIYATSIIILNLSGNRLTSLHFIVPMAADQSMSKRLTLQVANNRLKNLGKDTLRSLGRFKEFDISNNTELLCPCQGRHHPCLEYTQNWNEYVVLCLQSDDPTDFYHHITTKSPILIEAVTKILIERNETTTKSPTTTTKQSLNVGNTEGRSLETVTPASLSKLELTIVIVTLSITLVVIFAVTIAYVILRSKLQNQEGSSSEVKNGCEGETQACEGHTSYVEVDEDLRTNTLPFRLHLVTPFELYEPLYQAESVGSFIYTPPSESYFEPNASPTRELSYNGSYSQQRVPLERGLSRDGRSIYDPGIYNYDHIYEEIK